MNPATRSGWGHQAAQADQNQADQEKHHSAALHYERLTAAGAI